MTTPEARSVAIPDNLVGALRLLLVKEIDVVEMRQRAGVGFMLSDEYLTQLRTLLNLVEQTWPELKR